MYTFFTVEDMQGSFEKGEEQIKFIASLKETKPLPYHLHKNIL